MTVCSVISQSSYHNINEKPLKDENYKCESLAPKCGCVWRKGGIALRRRGYRKADILASIKTSVCDHFWPKKLSKVIP